MEYVERFLESISSEGIKGALGGLAYFLWASYKGKNIKWYCVFANIFIGFFVAEMIGHFIPAETPMRDGFIYMSGLASFPIVDFIAQGGWKKFLGFTLKIPVEQIEADELSE